jgi:hypothetical protein
MHDDNESTKHQDLVRKNPHLAGRMVSRGGRGLGGDDARGEESCAAFGYLRGIRERSDTIEFRLQGGDSIWFPYGWLGTWKFNRSEGLLLKFSGDLVYMVLVRGSNLDRPLSDSTTNLTTSGLARHRIVWMKEMGKEEIQRVGETGPTIDSIEIQEFESHDALRDWLQKTAPAFLK